MKTLYVYLLIQTALLICWIFEMIDVKSHVPCRKQFSKNWRCGGKIIFLVITICPAVISIIAYLVLEMFNINL